MEVVLYYAASSVDAADGSNPSLKLSTTRPIGIRGVDKIGVVIRPKRLAFLNVVRPERRSIDR